MSFVGDVCLGLGLQSTLQKRGPDWPFVDITGVLRESDLAVANLECTLVDDRCPFSLRSEPMAVGIENALGLKRAGIKILNLANNHALDCGKEGLSATMRFLDNQGLAYFGAGKRLSQAETACIVTHLGRRVGFLGACDVSRFYAGENTAGIAPYKLAALTARVRALRPRVDIVVVCLHADLEFTDYPSPGRIRASRSLVDAGASIVVQHHPHVCQGVERYRNGLIAYSLGNFVFFVRGNKYQESVPGTAHGVILQTTIDFRGETPQVDWSFVPTTITEDNRTILSSSDEAPRQLRHLKDISDALSDRKRVRREWWRRCHREVSHTALSAYYQLRRGQLLGAVATALRSVKVSENRRWLRGWMSGGLF